MPKCCICGKQLNKEDAYMFIHVSKTNREYKKYCCSLEEKENDERDKELYKKIQYLTDEILGYPCVNNNRNKRIQELQNAGYTNEQIYRCFKQYKEEIIKWIGINGIDKEFNKLAYMFSVVGANIKDFSDNDKCEWLEDKKVEEYMDENMNTFTEETDDDIKNRLFKQKKSNGFSDLLNKFK